MRASLFAVMVVVFGCSQREEGHAEPQVASGAAVVVHAPPTEIEGIPVAIALPRDSNLLQDVAIDGERVYVLAGDVYVASKSGGALKTLIDVAIDESTGTNVAMRDTKRYEYAKYYMLSAVQGGYLYLANRGQLSREMADATIERVALRDGVVEVIAKELPDRIDDMFVDETGVYLVTYKHAILKLALTGSAITTLYPAPTSEDDARYEVAFGGNSFFVAESTLDKEFAPKNATIVRVPKAGGAAKVIVSKWPSSVDDLIADETAVYWFDGKQTGVYRVDHAGKTKPRLVVKGYGEETHLHGKYLYRVVAHQLVRMLKDRGTEEKLKKLPKHASIVAVDDDAVWLASDGYILRHTLQATK